MALDADAQTFGGVAEGYIDYIENGTLRSASAIIDTIRRELLPVWRDRPMADISHKDVAGLIKAIVARGKVPVNGKKSGGGHAARAALAVLRQMCNWAVENGDIDVSPCASIRRAHLLHGLTKSDMERSRVLNDRELRLVRHAAGQINYPFGPLFQLLLLTGCRLSELSDAVWNEVDLDKAEIVIPPERNKVKTAGDKVVPFSSLAMETVTRLPRFMHGDYVFTTKAGRTPITTFSATKRKLEELLGDEVAQFRLHDLRRTCRTGLAASGVRDEVAEAIIGHTVTGVKGAYNRYHYYDEKRAGLEAWANRLMAIVDPPANANVGRFVAGG